ncbi:MAG: hypothetical protein ACYTGB_14740, partial [Planctomycetota bacterium]
MKSTPKRRLHLLTFWRSPVFRFGASHRYLALWPQCLGGCLLFLLIAGSWGFTAYELAHIQNTRASLGFMRSGTGPCLLLRAGLMAALWFGTAISGLLLFVPETSTGTLEDLMLLPISRAELLVVRSIRNNLALLPTLLALPIIDLWAAGGIVHAPSMPWYFGPLPHAWNYAGFILATAWGTMYATRRSWWTMAKCVGGFFAWLTVEVVAFSVILLPWEASAVGARVQAFLAAGLAMRLLAAAVVCARAARFFDLGAYEASDRKAGAAKARAKAGRSGKGEKAAP